MSVAVELANLSERVEEYGRVALVVSVGPESQPHVVSAAIGFSDGLLTATVGGTTSANAQRQQTVTIVWPARDGGDYCLIVDGRASIADAGGRSPLRVEPTRAVLHRVAGAAETLPSCVTVLDQRS